MLEDPLPGVGGRHVELQRGAAHLVGHRRQLLTGGRYVHRDDVRPGAVTYHRQASVNLVPGQVLVVDFDAEKGGITLQ